MCTLFMGIYKYSLFAYILLRFCVLPVFLSLLFYREDIDILYTFQVVPRVYRTDILSLFIEIFCVHFIDIFCTSFGRNFMKISLTFYITYFTELFSLNISQGLCSHFKRFFRILFKISVNFE